MQLILKSFKHSIVTLPIILLCILQLFPILTITITSLKLPVDLLVDGQALSLKNLHVHNYIQVIKNDLFLQDVWVSIKISSFATFFSVALASLATFGIINLELKSKKMVLLFVCFSRMIPPVSLSIPLFLVVSFLGIHDTIWGIVLAHISFILPFCIWLLLPFYDAIPKELSEAAKIDGLNSWQIFTKIYLPLSLPGLLVSGIFSFLFSWNDFLYSLILSGSETKTAPLAINGYMTSQHIEWGAMSASSIIIMIPIFLLSFFLQKNLIQKQNFSGIKG